MRIFTFVEPEERDSCDCDIDRMVQSLSDRQIFVPRFDIRRAWAAYSAEVENTPGWLDVASRSDAELVSALLRYLEEQPAT